MNMERMQRLEEIVSEINANPELIRGYNLRDRKMYAGDDLKKVPAIATAHEINTILDCNSICSGLCPSYSRSPRCDCDSYCSSECGAY